MTMLALPPAPAPARPRMLMIGTALAAAAGFMLIAGLAGVYLTLRDAAGGTTTSWLPEGASVNGVAMNTAFIGLLMSSITIQWAVYAIAHNDRRNAYIALGITVLFGVAFGNSMAFVYAQLGVGVFDGGAYTSIFYAITGTYLVLLAGAIVFTAVMAFRTLGGQYSAKEREGIAAAALFWHVTVAAFGLVWAVVFALR